MAYIDLIKQLDNDLTRLKVDYKKLQTDGQKNMYDFMRNRKPLAQFFKNGELVLLNRGDLVRGFEHILDRHYCQACPGIVTTRELLNIDMVLQKGRKLTTYEMNDRDHGAEGYEYITQTNIRLRLIIARDKQGIKRVVTFYSDRS
ncbi:hypothetical protein [Sulfuricurvum sp.]|uniref:hypothetical protein n=1 Tax=Sulfuricurvum sp. TaxID=2025608 RepID=UPI00260956D9|nr:hypothetical protein [Sulfuricurvum sp.]MDD3596183.1 hypothetical protein [Sulfuricurvum sp.]